jgi:hypothetical protein
MPRRLRRLLRSRRPPTSSVAENISACLGKMGLDDVEMSTSSNVNSSNVNFL